MSATGIVNPTTQVKQPLPGTKLTVARRYRVDVRTVERWMSLRIIPFMKIGGAVRFDMEQVEKHVREHLTVQPRGVR